METLSKSISQALYATEPESMTFVHSSDVLIDNEDSFEVNEVLSGETGDAALAEFLNSLKKQQEPKASTPCVLEVSKIADSLNSAGMSPCSESSASNPPPLRINVEKTPEPQEVTSPSGSVNPSIKNDLKSKIQTRRISQGIGELKVKFDPPKSYSLTEEEKDKIERRKQRNRDSANKSRLKRIAHEEQLRKDVEQLEIEQKKLKSDIQLYQGIKKVLRRKLSTHNCVAHAPTAPSTTSSGTGPWCGSSLNIPDKLHITTPGSVSEISQNNSAGKQTSESLFGVCRNPTTSNNSLTGTVPNPGSSKMTNNSRDLLRNLHKLRQMHTSNGVTTPFNGLVRKGSVTNVPAAQTSSVSHTLGSNEHGANSFNGSLTLFGS